VHGKDPVCSRREMGIFASRGEGDGVCGNETLELEITGAAINMGMLSLIAMLIGVANMLKIQWTYFLAGLGIGPVVC
jgi:hypothetical protein